MNYSNMDLGPLVARLGDLMAVHEGFWAWVDWLDREGGRAQFERQWGAAAVEIFARRCMSASAAAQEILTIEAELERRQAQATRGRLMVITGGAAQS